MSKIRDVPTSELEKTLIEYEQKFQSLADNSNVAIAATDVKGRFTYVNKALTELLGYSTQELLGTEFRKYLHPDDRGQIITLFLNIMVLKRQPRNMEFKALHKDGTVLNLISKPGKLRINGKTIGFLAIILDITKEKKIEEELRKSESIHKNTSEFLNNILSNMLDYVFIIDEDYTIKYLNEYAKKVYGNLIGQKCYKATRNLDQPCHDSGIKCEILEVIQKEKDVFEDTRKMDLSGRIAHVRAKPIQTYENKQAIIVVVRDVTEEKKSKEELGKSLSLLRTTFESTVDGILVTDLNRKITKYNRRFIEILKIPEHIMKSRNDNEVIEYLTNKIKDPENFVKRIEESFSNPKVESLDFLKFQDGRIIERYSRPQCLNEKVIGRVLSFRDITERKRMEEELKNYSEHLAEMVQQKTKELAISERLLQTTIENVPDHVYVKSRERDSNGGFKYIYVNDAYHKFHNKTKKQIIGKTNYDLYPKDQAKLFTKEDLELFKKGKSILGPDTTVSDSDGDVHVIQTVKAPIKDQKGIVNYIIGITRDLTERKQLEKMKDQFISAVTHELRTPLVSIKAYVDYPLTGKMGPLSEEMKSNLEIVKRNTDRLLELTGDLLDLRRMESGKLELNKESMDFQNMVEHCIEEIKPMIREKKQLLDVNSPNQPLMVNGDKVRLSQALMNLLSNANKFTPEGGKILLDVKTNRKIHVELSDTGIGIRRRDLERVFEPFSAITKPTYIPGTGLGLSVTKGLIEAHEGKIWVNSQGEGKGSTFIFELPKI